MRLLILTTNAPLSLSTTIKRTLIFIEPKPEGRQGSSHVLVLHSFGDGLCGHGFHFI